MYSESINGAVRIEITDAALAQKVAKAFDKLEQYYPEHKVFSFDNINTTLRDTFSNLYKAIGYKDVEEMLNAYGFEGISSEEAKKLRNEVKYKPGEEPEIIKSRIESIITLLNNYYPDHVITSGITSTSKKLSGYVTGAYLWLGYPSISAFLAAYGFQYNPSDKGGRPKENNYDELVEKIIEFYKDKDEKPKTVSQIQKDMPEYTGKIKTLYNKAQSVFGMPLSDYLTEKGVINKRSRTNSDISSDAVLDLIESIITNKIHEIYSSLDPQKYGTAEEAIESLRPFKTGLRKNGNIAIKKVIDCPQNVVIPYGVGDMSDGVFEGQKNLNSVDIRANLFDIPDETFKGCSGLKRINLPKVLTYIGKSAFEGCSGLEEITIPDSVMSIYEKAFAGCSSLKSIHVPHIKTISNHTFFECKSLREVLLEEGTKVIEEYAFSKCTSLETIVIPSSVKTIGNRAFEECTGLTNIALEKGLLNIMVGAFSGCTSLETIAIPSSVKTIESYAFEGCTGLTSIVLDEGLQNIEAYAFSECTSVEKIVIPQSVRNIDDNAFNGCVNLKIVRYKGNETIVSEHAFNNCPYPNEVLNINKKQYFYNSKIKNFKIASKTVCIDKYAFAWSSQLETVSVPKEVIEIDSEAFTGCTALTEIKVDSENERYCSVDGLLLSKDKTRLIICPAGKTNVTIPDCVTEIGEKAFKWCVNLKQVIIPESVKTIGYQSFSDCNSLRKITIPKSVEKIENCAFQYCTDIEINIMSESVSISEDATIGCLKLKKNF